MPTSAIYYDGKSAREQQVNLIAYEKTLIFSGAETPETTWTIAGLHPVGPPSPGQPYRLTHSEKPGSRLIIRDADFVAALVRSSAHLKGGYSWADVGNILGWTLGGLAAVLALGYIFMTFLPGRAAYLLPETWRNRMGKEMEASLVGSAKICHTPAGDAAIGAMIANLAEGAPDLPPISVHVYDIGILNAFAVPGGSIIITRELLAKADAPDEVAGVLAHEIGHVAHRHPEAQLVRVYGLNILTSIVTGTNGGNTSASLASVAALLRYSRQAEAEADAYARDTLKAAAISPLGLKAFFGKVLKMEGEHKIDSGPLSALGNLFTTHPGTEERIKEIVPLPEGVVAKPSLNEEQWQALKKICG